MKWFFKFVLAFLVLGWVGCVPQEGIQSLGAEVAATLKAGGTGTLTLTHTNDGKGNASQGYGVGFSAGVAVGTDGVSLDADARFGASQAANVEKQIKAESVVSFTTKADLDTTIKGSGTTNP